MPPIINTQRKLAPDALVSKPYVSDRVLLVEKAKAKLGAKARNMHFFFGDKNIADSGRYAEEGYEPTGFAHKGDPLLMRPEATHKRHLEEAAIDSQVAYQAAQSASDDKYKTRADNGDVIGPETLKE